MLNIMIFIHAPKKTGVTLEKVGILPFVLRSQAA